MSEIKQRLTPGVRYRVTAVVEGVADKNGEIVLSEPARQVYANYQGVLRVSGLADSIEKLAPVEPTYKVGSLYRDAEGDIVLRTEEHEDGPWILVSQVSGHLHYQDQNEAPGVRWFEETLVRPLVELELKEKRGSV